MNATVAVGAAIGLAVLLVLTAGSQTGTCLAVVLAVVCTVGARVFLRFGELQRREGSRDVGLDVARW